MHVFRTPSYARSLFIRRSIALGLVLAAVVIAVGGAREPTVEVVLYRNDVAAGTRLQEEDLVLRSVPLAHAPPHASNELDALVDAIVIAPRAAGMAASIFDVIDPTTTLRVSNPTSTPMQVVPLTLADPTIATLLHHGDTIDVVSADPNAEVIATGGTVVFAANAQTDEQPYPPGVVLIALPEQQAREVAATTIAQPLTVVLTGQRVQ